MKIQFRTSIDCCKRFMGEVKNATFIPQEGDWVTVHVTDKFVVEMKVCNRIFTYNVFNNDKIESDKVEVYLNSPNNMTISLFETILKAKGYY